MHGHDSEQRPWLAQRRELKLMPGASWEFKRRVDGKPVRVDVQHAYAKLHRHHAAIQVADQMDIHASGP